MSADDSFLCKGCLIGNHHLSRENGICSPLSKVTQCKSNGKYIFMPLRCLHTLRVKGMHVLLLEIPKDSLIVNSDCVR